MQGRNDLDARTCQQQVASAPFKLASLINFVLTLVCLSLSGTDMARTLNQKIAEAEARLARLRKQERSLEMGQKIILGGMLLNAVRHDPKMRDWLLEEAAQSIIREADQKRLKPLIEELRIKI